MIDMLHWLAAARPDEIQNALPVFIIVGLLVATYIVLLFKTIRWSLR